MFASDHRGAARELARVTKPGLGDRREELHRAWVEFFETRYREDGGIAHTRAYLLVLGTRR